jgi:hypothetical protein
MKKIILFIVLLSSFLTNAQWQTNTAVNTQVSNTVSGDSQSVTNSVGGTYVVYWKTVATPVNYEIWVQYLDAAGMKIFGDNGILVTNTLPMSTFTNTWKVTVDGKDNLYVSVTGTGAGTPGYVYKINPAGEIVWSINVGPGYVPTVLPLSDFGVIISYWPGSGKAKMQRYNEIGTPLWPAPIDVNPNTANATRPTMVADMFEQSNGYFTAVFHTRTGNFGVNSLLFAQRYNLADGASQWTQPTQLADKGSTYNNFSYGGVQDGDVIYYGYSLSTVSRFDAFAQRINTDGTLPWGINGIDFDTNITSYEINAKIAFQTGSQYIWMISTYTPSSQGTYGEYVQKFDKVTGARQFTDNALQVYPIDSNSRMHAGNLYLVNDRPLFGLKSGTDNGVTPTTLSAQFLDTNGNFTATDVVPLATFSANKSRITFNRPVNNQGVITFSEQKTAGQTNMYAHNFSTLVGCTVTPAATADVTLPCSAAFADLTVPTGTDSCGTLVTATTDETIFPITANTTITWTFTAASGATATQTQNIIISSTVEPTVLADATFPCNVEVADITAPVIADSCGNTITATTDESVFPITANTSITWTFTAASGAVATQTQNIVINNILAPPALEDITSQCAVAITDLTAPVITDSCGNTVTPTTDETVFPIRAGTTAVIWTYTSSTGAVATQTQNITVTNTIAPTLVLQNISAEVTEDGTVTLTASGFNNGSTNGCSGSTDTSSWTWSVAPAGFTCDDLGEQTVTVTAADANGNIATATATVTVTDPNGYCIAATENFNKQLVTLYPNPANDIFTINSTDAIRSVIVYDMVGKIVFSSMHPTANPAVDVKEWSAGIYHVYTQDINGNQQRFKLVKN